MFGVNKAKRQFEHLILQQVTYSYLLPTNTYSKYTETLNLPPLVEISKILLEMYTFTKICCFSGVAIKATRPLKNSNVSDYVKIILIDQKYESWSLKISLAECRGAICLCNLTSNTFKEVPLFEGVLHINRDFFCFVSMENYKKE